MNIHIILKSQPVSVVFKDKHLSNYISGSINDKLIIENDSRTKPP